MDARHRRSVLRTIAGLGVAGLAGCSGGSADTDDQTNDGQSGEQQAEDGEETTTAGEDGAALAAPSFLTKLTAEDADRNDNLGRAAALAGETIVLTAPGDEDPNGRESGSAYVFTREGGSWSQQAKLAPNDGERDDVFGNAVTFEGETIVIGAAADDDPHGSESGSVYVFENGEHGWTQQAKLVAEDGQRFDRFGQSVALSGDTLLVGAPSHAGFNGNDAGAVYVFGRSEGTWTQREKFGPIVLDRADFFGTAVALAGDTALVGAPGDEDPNGGQAGRVYAFERSGGSWDASGRFAPEDGLGEAHFGWSIDLVGDRVVVGAPDDGAPDYPKRGAAYVFDRVEGSWVEQAKLVGDESRTFDEENDIEDYSTVGYDPEGDRFGFDVALLGDVVVAGAPRDEEPHGPQGGAAYAFQLVEGTWTKQAKFSSRHGRPEDNFGWSVVAADGLALVGVPREDLAEGHSAGAAHLYEL